MLPDGVARLVLVEPPRGVLAREYVRYRLASSLPWPAEEGVFDTLDAGSGRVVGAAVRRATVAEYEQAASAAGARVEQVHLAPLLALAGLLRERRADGRTRCSATWRCASPSCARAGSGRCAAGAATARRAKPRGCARSCCGSLRGPRTATAACRSSVSGSDAPRLRPDLGPGAAGERARTVPALSSGAEAGWLRGLVP